MNDNPIPQTAIQKEEPYGSGSRGSISLRAHALREAENLLLQGTPKSMAGNRLRCLGQAIARQLWTLLARLLEHERAVQHIYDELQLTRERLGDLPPFQYSEPKDIARTRATAEELRCKLGQELRQEHRRWLEARAETETSVAELLKEYQEVLEMVEADTQETTERPSLSILFRFLSEPADQPVIVLEPPSTIEASAAGVLP